MHKACQARWARDGMSPPGGRGLRPAPGLVSPPARGMRPQPRGKNGVCIPMVWRLPTLSRCRAPGYHLRRALALSLPSRRSIP